MSKSIKLSGRQLDGFNAAIKLGDPNLVNSEIQLACAKVNGMGTIFKRVWAMPNSDTFNIPVVAAFVSRYLSTKLVSVDPFARNNSWSNWTNDINPNTTAGHHMDARSFLKHLEELGVVADLMIFDPPYSPRQISEHYKEAGLVVNQQDTQNSVLYGECRRWFNRLTKVGSVVLSFGWNSVGMGKGWEIIEVMLVCHGGAHNDTICMAERRIENPQRELTFQP